jgi:hypothetical protein
MGHQKEAGVFATVSGLVDQLCDNPAAKVAPQEIMERLQRAEEAPPVTVEVPGAPAPGPGCSSGGCVVGPPAT